MQENKLKRYLSFWEDELNSAMLYEVLSKVEKDERIGDVYRRMAEAERGHAAHWAARIQELGGTLPEFRPRWRARILAWLGKRFGPEMVLPGMKAMEDRGSGDYRHEAGAQKMQADEQSHSRLIQQITRTSGGFEGGALAALEGRHRSVGGNALRAAVLGANDGLVSNLSLVMGVAGAALDNRTILITGLAGMLAGSISMALGEWLSVQSSRELYEHQIAIEAEEIEATPEEEEMELALIYEARGLKPEQARLLASQIIANSGSALETLAREELGVDPQELGGSAWEAAITSFVLFSVGAIIPVIAFTFLSGMAAVVVSIAMSMLGLFLLGAASTLMTGRPVLYSGMRMVIFGLLAAAVTFGIGRLIGVGLT